MNRPKFSILSIVLALSLILAACGGTPQATDAVPQGQETMPVAQLPEATDAMPPTAAAPGGAGEPQAATEVPAATVPPAGGGAPIPVTQGQGFGETLRTVQSRGTLICAVNGQLPGFSFLDPDGQYSGFDVDFCRALSAAIFGNPDQVEFRPTNTQERFTVLQTGEVDVLSRNTTWSLARDTELGLNFPAVTFYDGQGIMVPNDSGLTSLADLEGATICVQ